MTVELNQQTIRRYALIGFSMAVRSQPVLEFALSTTSDTFLWRWITCTLEIAASTSVERLTNGELLLPRLDLFVKVRQQAYYKNEIERT